MWRSKLQPRVLRRTSWAVGEFVHRDLVEYLGANSIGQTASANSIGQTASANSNERTASASTNEQTATANSSPRPTTQWSAADSIQPANLGGKDQRRPFSPRPVDSIDNPVLTVADVTDYGEAEFVADPFLFPTDSKWNLFFEIFNRDRRPTGVIGHATSEDGGRSWTYNQIVLHDKFHLAFPYIFEYKNYFYMVPDRWNRERPASIQLFRTASLPDGWEPVTTIVAPDRQLADCIVFQWENRWWALLGSDDGRYELCAYYTDDLLADGWTPHRDNPVVSGRPRGARPAGRPIVGEDGVLLFLQDCAAQYGDKVRAFDVTRLAPGAYADRERPESPILGSANGSFGWNSGRMHHIDPWHTDEGWLCAVDGNVGFGRSVFGPDHWAIGMYRG